MSRRIPSVPGVVVEQRVPVPMSDGTVLRADVYRPDDAERHPALVERVCYEPVNRGAGNGAYYAQRGYAVVIQSSRGAFGSEGVFRPFRDDAWGANRDGYDTIEWVAAQPWATGRVGMLDGSYSGFTQYLTAPTRPPHLAALFPRQSGGDVYHDFVYRDGTYGLFYQDWCARTVLTHLEHAGADSAPAAGRIRAALRDVDHWHWQLPLADRPYLTGAADWYFEQLAHPEYGPYWHSLSLSLVAEQVDVPSFHLGSWYDLFLAGTLRAFTAIRRRARREEVRRSQRLVIGPWIHGPSNVGQRVVGDLDFGPEAEVSLHDLRLSWYDYWLRGEATGVLNTPPIRVFLMGENCWLGLEDWPPPDAQPLSLYLRAGPDASARSLNAGRLSRTAPADAEQPDSFSYDPTDPVPSLVGFPGLGPRDYSPLEPRMLTYTSEPLGEDLVALGPVRAELWVLSTAPDTDWMVRVCDVWPDGRSMSVCDGVRRASYRESCEQPAAPPAGSVYRVEVDLWSTAQVFRAGHRVRLEVTSSDFPRYARHPNTAEPLGLAVRTEVALNTVFHDVARPARLVLSTVPAGVVAGLRCPAPGRS